MTVTRLAVAEASAHMLRGVGRLGTETAPLAEALGRVLARDVVSPVSLPLWDNSSMDGYAARAADVRAATAGSPVRLRVLETVAAGARGTRRVGPGEATRIMTGAPVPEGADSVIRVEDTESEGDAVLVRDGRDAARNVRPCGEDVREGAVVARAGIVLGAAHLGVLSSVGCAEPHVYRRPRVAVLATGDELVPLSGFDAVRRGERIVSSNSYSLEGAVRAAGGVPVPLGIAPDEPGALARALRGADGCDLVLTTGGVSVGDFDYTTAAVETLGGSLSLWRVRMRPGAPLAFGSLFGAPWLGLPGNPVSALVTFELFGRPLLRTLAGHARPHRRSVAVVLDEPLQLAAPLTHFIRVTLLDGDDGIPRARLTGSQSSGMLTSMSSADALLVVPPEPAELPAGAVLRAIPLDGGLGASERFPA